MVYGGSEMEDREMAKDVSPNAEAEQFIPKWFVGKPIDKALNDVQELAKQPKKIEYHVTDALVEVANNLATALMNTAREHLEKAQVNHDKAVKLANDIKDKAIAEHNRLLEITSTYNEYGTDVLAAYDRFVEALNGKK